jgi:hypothetical protein
MRPYLITAKLMRPSNMKRFPTPVLEVCHVKALETHYTSVQPRGKISKTVAYAKYCEPGSSVSVVSGYRLDGRAIEVRSPTETKGFFLYPLCPDRLWGPPSLLYNGYRGVPFPGAKARPDHSPPSSAEV